MSDKSITTEPAPYVVLVHGPPQVGFRTQVKGFTMYSLCMFMVFDECCCCVEHVMGSCLIYAAVTDYIYQSQHTAEWLVHAAVPCMLA